MTQDLSLELAQASAPTYIPQAGVLPSPVQYLGYNHIPMALHFIEAVRDTLAEHQKHFLKPKSAGDMEAHLIGGAPLLGVLSKNSHVLAFGMVSGTSSPQLPQGHAIIQAVCSRGGGLGRAVVSAAEDWAHKNHFSAISAKISKKNRASLALFNAYGFSAVSERYDQQGDYTYYVVTKQLAHQ